MKCYLVADGLPVLWRLLPVPWIFTASPAPSPGFPHSLPKIETNIQASGGQVGEIALLIAGGQRSEWEGVKQPLVTASVQTLHVRVVHQGVPNKVAGERVWLCWRICCTKKVLAGLECFPAMFLV